MGRGRLTAEEIRILKQNPYVSDVEESRILYTNEFKYLFMQEYLEGKKPTKIFIDAGFDPKILGSKRIERATQRWKESFAAGTLGSYQNATIRNKVEIDIKNSDESKICGMYLEIIEIQRKKIRRLQEENEKLKAQLDSSSVVL